MTSDLQRRAKELRGEAANQLLGRAELLNADVCVEAHILEAQYGCHHHRQAALLRVCEAQIDLRSIAIASSAPHPTRADLDAQAPMALSTALGVPPLSGCSCTHFLEPRLLSAGKQHHITHSDTQGMWV